MPHVENTLASCRYKRSHEGVSNSPLSDLLDPSGQRRVEICERAALAQVAHRIYAVQQSAARGTRGCGHGIEDGAVIRRAGKAARRRGERLVLLQREGIKTADDMFFKLPTPQDLEDFLRSVLFQECTYVEEDSGVIVDYPRNQISQETYAVWKRGDDAASIRKLWKAAKAEADKDLESLLESKPETEIKKISAVVAADMHEKALKR